MKHLVISFLGKDRPGLVDNLSQTIHNFKGNWQASAMNQLSGYFAGILEVSVPEQFSQDLASALEAIDGLKFNIEITDATNKQVVPSLRLDLTANDRAGIIQEISSVIHSQGGNMIKLVSTQGNAPHFGGQIFKAKVTIALAEEKTDQLVEALEGIANDLIVDIIR